MSDTLKRAVRQSGQSWYRIAKNSGVPYATLHAFLCGKRGIALPTVDKLCRYLGLRLTR